jgi:hypothetical protein
MIEENVPGSEFVNILANNISSWCTSSRATIFTWGTDTEQCKVSDIPSRNSETSNFQNWRVDSETKLNLSKKECNASSYVECAILTPPEQENSSNGLQERKY